jgi:hypothetical protein
MCSATITASPTACPLTRRRAAGAAPPSRDDPCPWRVPTLCDRPKCRAHFWTLRALVRRMRSLTVKFFIFRYCKKVVNLNVPRLQCPKLKKKDKKQKRQKKRQKRHCNLSVQQARCSKERRRRSRRRCRQEGNHISNTLATH